MTCHEVRDALTEFALGLLPDARAHRVEWHLEWCAGCRKELAGLQEGAAAVALSLPPVEVPPGLEERVVRQIAAAAGRLRHPTGRVIRGLLASTLAAVLAAFGALGWAIAERNNVEQVKEDARAQIRDLEDVVSLLRSFPGTPLQATLLPAMEEGGSIGSATLYTGPGDDFIVVKVFLEEEDVTGLYTAWVLDGTGRPVVVGRLQRTPNGDWVFYQPGEDLSRGTSVEVRNESGTSILRGRFKVAQTPRLVEP